MSPLGSAVSRASGVALRPAAGAIRLGRGVERAARRAAADALIATVEGWLASPEPERIATAVLDHEGTERLLVRIVESPAAERLVALLVDRGLLDTALARLVEREQLWILVEEIARSPAVTEAIAHQSRSAVDGVADELRGGSRRADAWLDQLAQRLTPGRRAAVPEPTTPAADGEPAGGSQRADGEPADDGQRADGERTDDGQRAERGTPQDASTPTAAGERPHADEPPVRP